ncbi:Selenium-binding protein 3 [Zea mays]|uniref:Selenium-binding protein 3 n=1 Tax=Zea mays TaxID=4577 RepID=A0A1D6G695_MAIZE|nr:Selenium-binding protein 3 [Zea mays]
MARAAVDAPPANGGTCCHATKGLGYATSLEAMEKGPREKLVYITCVYNGTGINKLDYLATMDLDPDSPTYSQEGNTTGNGFLLLDSEFNVKGRWEKPGHSPLFGYDFWYQPHHKTMISSSWGAPAAFRTCFNPQHVAISIKPLKVRNWFLPEMPGLITDFVISLDDRYHYLVHWLHGDIRQYNIEDPAKPFLAGQVWVGGLLPKGGDVVYVTDDSQEEQYNVPQVKVTSLQTF